MTLSTERVTDINDKEQNAIVDLLTRNMKKLYEESNWGWNEKNKRSEMLEDAAWYLMARNSKGELYGFSHFRYDMDFDDEVLYVYEVSYDFALHRLSFWFFFLILKVLSLTILTNFDYFKNQMISDPIRRKRPQERIG